MASDSSKPRRQKRKLEPITFEELYSTSNMSGFVSFLEAPPGATVALPHLAPGSGAGAPEPSAPKTSALGLGAVPSANRVLGAPELSAPLQSAPEIGALPSPAPPSPTSLLPSLPPEAEYRTERRRPRVREAFSVQDGHSYGEQALYETMYRLARPYHGDDIRILTIGYRTLAERGRMAYSNCKLNVRSLISKLAIAPVGRFTYTEGTTFLVFSYREVLRRRRAAGMTYVIRQKGVIFVDPVTLEEVKAAPLESGGAPDSSAPESTLKSDSSAPVLINSSAPVSGALSLDTSDIENRTSSSTDDADRRTVLQALTQLTPVVDDEAAIRLITACRERAPDVTAEEIAAFVTAKAQQILRSREVRNPLGLIQVAVPKCFEGESFRLYRETELQRVANAAAARSAAEAEWRAVLQDPAAEEDLKQLARRALGLVTPG